MMRILSPPVGSHTGVREGASMSPASQAAIDEGRDELTAEETRAFLEEQTRKHYGLDLATFVEQAEAGEIPADDGVLVHLALLTGAKLPSC